MNTFELVIGIGLVIAGYIVGSIPVGYLIGRYWFGADLFKQGSRRMGATNALRVIGVRAAALIFVADMLKGAIPALAAGLLLAQRPEFQAIAGLAAVAGHSWSIFVGLRGGRGVATAFGAALVIFPLAILLAVPVGMALIIILRYASVASMGAALISLGSGVLLYVSGLWSSTWGLIFVASAVFLILWQHRENMRRLARGTELRLAEWPTYFRTELPPRGPGGRS